MRSSAVDHRLRVDVNGASNCCASGWGQVRIVGLIYKDLQTFGKETVFSCHDSTKRNRFATGDVGCKGANTCRSRRLRVVEVIT
jgi:hypothetical protein